MATKAMEGLLMVVSGPSGTGKSTVCGNLLKKNPRLYLSISATTREPRRGERNGKDYYFVSKEEFEKMRENDLLLEWAEVYGNFYGTPRQPVQRELGAGRDVLLEIDIQGALKVKKKVPEAVLVFIAPPSLNELKSRLISRKADPSSVIEKRFQCVKEELKFIPSYDYVVVNDKLERAVHKICSILEAEKCRPRFYNLFMKK